MTDEWGNEIAQDTPNSQGYWENIGDQSFWRSTELPVNKLTPLDAFKNYAKANTGQKNTGIYNTAVDGRVYAKVAKLLDEGIPLENALSQATIGEPPNTYIKQKGTWYSFYDPSQIVDQFNSDPEKTMYRYPDRWVAPYR